MKTVYKISFHRSDFTKKNRKYKSQKLYQSMQAYNSYFFIYRKNNIKNTSFWLCDIYQNVIFEWKMIVHNFKDGSNTPYAGLSMKGYQGWAQ